MGILGGIIEKINPKQTADTAVSFATKGIFGAIMDHPKGIQKIGEAAKSFGQAIPRAITSVGIQPAAELLTAAGKPTKAEFTPTTPFQQAVFGKKPIEGVFPKTERIFQKTKEIAEKVLPKDASAGAALGLAPIVVAGSIGLDLSPIGGEGKAGKEIAEDILKTLGKGARKIHVEELFHGSDAGKMKIDDLGNINFSPIKEGLERFGKVIGLDAKKMNIVEVSTPEILFDAVKNHETKQRLIDGGVDALKAGDHVIAINPTKLSSDVQTPLRLGTIKDKTIGELTDQRAGNIRLDKFDLPDADRQNLANIINANDGFKEQRRGTMSFFETEKLAEDIVPSLKLKTGTALNAEELHALGNSVANLQVKVNDAANLARNPETATELNLLKFAQAKEELSYALSSYAGARTEAGRSLSILRDINKAVASNDIDLIQKVAKQLDSEELKGIASALINTPDNLGKINIIRNAAKIPLKDKLYEVFINGILANPLTHAVNATSNQIKSMSKPVIRAVQAGIQKPGEREVFIGEIPHQIIGMVEGINDGVRRALYMFQNGLTEDAVSKLEISHLPAIGGRTGEVIRIPTRLLGSVDEFFKAINETGELRATAYRIAKKEGKTGEEAIARMHELAQSPTVEMYDAAKRSAKEGTFQQDLGKAGGALMSLRDKWPGLRYIIPFIKTPTNIAKDALKTSPLGYAEVIRKLATGTYKDLPANQVTEDIAKATIGSMIAIPTAMAAMQGKITGAAPKNQSERDAFYRDKEPYSIKIGDKWVSYRRLEPYGTVLGLIADFVQLKDEGEMSKNALNIATLLGRNLNDKTFLAGISSMIDALNDPSKTASWYSNIIAGMVPFSGTQRFATRLIDPTVRKPQGIAETLMAQTPGLSKRVTPLRTAFGEEVKRNLSQIISPISAVKKEDDVVSAELSRLGVEIGFPRASIQKMDLNKKEYDDFLRISGQTTKKVLENLISKSAWGELTDGQKEKIIEQVKTRVRDRVREKLFPGKTSAGDIRRRLLEKGMSAEAADTETEKIVQRLEGKNP
jgi:hypothetical protein